MLALPALPAPLIIPKTKRTVRAPISAPRTHRRYPVVRPPAMLAPSADRHTSRLFQKPPPPATNPASTSTPAKDTPFSSRPAPPPPLGDTKRPELLPAPSIAPDYPTTLQIQRPGISPRGLQIRRPPLPIDF